MKVDFDILNLEASRISYSSLQLSDSIYLSILCYDLGRGLEANAKI